MRPIVTIRPAPGDARTVALGREFGLDILSFPLFAVEPVEWEPLDPAAHDAVLFGSANALRHGGAGLATLRTLPALCVGETTAQSARQAGFRVAAVGSGGLQSVIPAARQHGLARLARLSGEAHVPLDLSSGMTVTDRILYRVAAHPIADDLAKVLRDGALVLLHSGEAAAHFATEVDRTGIDRGAIALACLAPRIAERAGKGWCRLSTADRTEDGALLAMAAQMCQA